MKTINCAGKLISFERPLVMGILNVTPDSFFDGGYYFDSKKIEERIKKIITEGADLIDVGAYSTKPYASEVSEKEELKRLCNALEIVRKHFPDAIISVDTFRANIASFVIENFNVDIINDIFAGRADEKMLETIAKYQVPYIMMHMQGTPQTMQIAPKYDNVVIEILKFFSERIEVAIKFGINDLIIDPGL